MSFKILRAGLQTTLQDFGRNGYRAIGIPLSGAIDSYSFQLANWLVSKPLNSACLEIYLIGPEIKFLSEMTIGITGAHFDLTLNGKTIHNNQTIHVKSGDILCFGKCRSGARAYLAFSGKPNYKTILDSLSTDTTSGIITTDSPIENGSIIKLIEHSNHSSPIKTIPKELIINYKKSHVIRVTTGLESHCIDHTELYSNEYKVEANSNRMGLRLFGETIRLNNNLEMISSPVTVGTIQLPTNGQPIITLNEGQTIGGYPRIAQVISADLPLLGQLAPNTKVSFYPVAHEKAKQIYYLKNKPLRNS